MHPCLLISEIFTVILEHIYLIDKAPNNGHRLGRQTLASLARTCRALSSPALDQLWACLERFDPFLGLLPQRMWNRSSIIVVSLARLFMGKKYWFRFHKYAVRVRHLYVPDRRFFPRSVIIAFASLPSASFPLLPNLTLLSWNTPRDVDIMWYLVGPALTDLSLCFQPWPSRGTLAATIISKLPTLCPNVTSFATSHESNFTSTISPECISDLIQGWPLLQNLRTGPLFHPQLIQLASKKALGTLTIEIGKDTHTFVGQLPKGIHTFSLHVLYLELGVDYLQRLQGSPTNLTLRLGLIKQHPAPMIDTLVVALTTSFDTCCIRTLTIDTFSLSNHLFCCTWNCAEDKPQFAFTEPLLAPLYAFSELRALDLGGVCMMEVDDAAYARMAGAWPELRSLTAGTVGNYAKRPAASVEGLLTVLKGCPFLERLEMVFDGSIPPPRPVMVAAGGVDDTVAEAGDVRAQQSTASWGVSNLHLTWINVGRSPIGDRKEDVDMDVDAIADMGRCLRAVMPRLERIQCRGEKHMPRWHIVQEIVEMRV